MVIEALQIAKGAQPVEQRKQEKYPASNPLDPEPVDLIDLKRKIKVDERKRAQRMLLMEGQIHIRHKSYDNAEYNVEYKNRYDPYILNVRPAAQPPLHHKAFPPFLRPPDTLPGRFWRICYFYYSMNPIQNTTVGRNIITTF